jgi:hypothetical protein
MVDPVTPTRTSTRNSIGTPARRLVALALGVASILAATIAIAGSPQAATAGGVPREHRVAVFADSVGLGARTAIPNAFPPDWEVNVDGDPARFVEQLESDFVKYRLAVSPHWFGDHVVIAGGYNYPYWDPERFDRSIDSIVTTLTNAGVKHVYWVTLRDVDPQYISDAAWRQVQPYYWYFPTVNTHLERALARHPNLTLIDWAANANQPGLTYDAIHLNTTGSALYSNLIRSTVESTATSVPDGSTTKIHVPGGEGATAATVNLTTTHARRAGHLVIHRCDQPPPNTSVHNFTRSQIVAHAALAPLDANGDFCVTTISQTNLVVDVTGLLWPDRGFTAVTPTRWWDTRAQGGGRKLTGGQTLELELGDVRAAAGITGDPKALALIVTSAEDQGAGHVTVSSCGTDADHSNVNFGGGAATPNLVFVEPSADDTICLFAATTTHLIVDLFGVFDQTAEIGAGAPTRLFDSRQVGAGSKVAAQGIVEIDVGRHLSDDATGAILNLTGVLPDAAGHFTAFPCAAGLPESSNLNYGASGVVANAAVISPDADGHICIATHAAAHVVVDLLGEFGDVFTGSAPTRVLDTRRP